MNIIRSLAAILLLLFGAVACEGGGFGIFGISGGGTEGGTVTGQVTADGSPAGGVTILLVNRDSVRTDSQGTYRFGDLATGTYTLSIRVPVGFRLAAGEDAIREANVSQRGTATVNWRLESSIGATARH